MPVNRSSGLSVDRSTGSGLSNGLQHAATHVLRAIPGGLWGAAHTAYMWSILCLNPMNATWRRFVNQITRLVDARSSVRSTRPWLPIQELNLERRGRGGDFELKKPPRRM